MPQQTATAVMPLTDSNLEILKKMQMNHPIPEGAKYIAFLEDGDACFLTEDLPRWTTDGGINLPSMHLMSFYENVQIEYED